MRASFVVLTCPVSCAQVPTFGPGVCYDAPPKLMYQQFGFFKTGLEAKKVPRVRLCVRLCNHHH